MHRNHLKDGEKEHLRVRLGIKQAATASYSMDQ